MSAADPDVVQLSTIGDGKAREAILAQLSQQLTVLGWSPADVFGLQLAVEESVSNAYHHGNLEGQRGDVRLRWQVSESMFRIEIQDCGDGFEESEVPDPTDLDNLENLGGRGLLLMRSYMTSVQFEDGGRTVVMQKTREKEPS